MTNISHFLTDEQAPNASGSAVSTLPTVTIGGALPLTGVIGQTFQLTATASDRTLAPVVGAVFVWSSTNPGVASVDSTGLVRFLAQGSCEITASYSGTLAAVSATCIRLVFV